MLKISGYPFSRAMCVGLSVIHGFVVNDFALQAGPKLVGLRGSVAIHHPVLDESSLVSKARAARRHRAADVAHPSKDYLVA